LAEGRAEFFDKQAPDKTQTAKTRRPNTALPAYDPEILE